MNSPLHPIVPQRDAREEWAAWQPLRRTRF